MTPTLDTVSLYARRGSDAVVSGVGWRAPDTDKVDGNVDRERRLEFGRERERLGVFAGVHVVRER
jgi:hypothetical protein